jgi:hypothetical protein
MAITKPKQVTEAVPDDPPVRQQPVRRVEAPPRSEFDQQNNRTLEPDTSQPMRGSGRVTSSILSQDTMAQLRAGAEANGIELPGDGVEEPVEITDEGEVVPVETRPNVTRVQDVTSPDPRAPISVFTDKRKAPVQPKAAERTRIPMGPIDEAIVSEERMVRIKPKQTCQRWIGPYRYHFTKDVVCDVPESVRDAMLREELIVPYYH